MTHRAIMLASLATGQSTIYKPLLGEDCLRTIEIFKLLGVNIELAEEKIIVDSPGYNKFKTPSNTIYWKFWYYNTIISWFTKWAQSKLRFVR